MSEGEKKGSGGQPEPTNKSNVNLPPNGENVNWRFAGLRFGTSTWNELQTTRKFTQSTPSNEDELRAVFSHDWTPAIHKDGYPTDENFISCDFLFGDVDDGLTVAEFAERFKKYSFIVTTSRNHQKPKNGKTVDRFHFLLILEKPIESEAALRSLMLEAEKKWPFMDRKSMNPGRKFFAVQDTKVILNPGERFSFRPLEGEPLEPGNRHDAILSFGANLWKNPTTSKETLLEECQRFNQESCSPPKPEKEVRDIVAWITKKSGAKNVFELLKVSELKLEAPSWLVKNLIPDNAQGQLIGESEAGKSFLAVDLACCVGTGTDFHGFKIKKPGPVVYIAGEGFAGYNRRFKAWELHNGVEVENVYLSKQACVLIDGESMRAVHGAVATIQDSAGKPSLIILDTLNRNFGGNENDTGDMTKAVQSIDLMRNGFDCTVLVVHHVGLQDKKRGRGSNTLRASADFEFLFAVNGDARVLSCIKSKDGKRPSEIAFKFLDVDLKIRDEDGQTVSSAVLVSSLVPPHEIKFSPVDERILEIIDANPEGVKPADVATKTGQTTDGARMALGRLLKRGLIEKRGNGSFCAQAEKW